MGRHHLCMAHHRAARVFKVTLQAEHEGMAVDNAGAGRMQGGHARQSRLHGPGLIGADQHHIGHAIGMRLVAQGQQAGQLAVVGGHHQLAATPVRHTALGGIGVEHVTPLHTPARLARPLGVVNAGMDDLAVARAGTGANRRRLLQHQPLRTRLGQTQGTRRC